LGGKDVVVKKEMCDENNISCEYNFFIKYSNNIKKAHFDKFILLPVDEIKKCEDSIKGKWFIYTFEKLNWDYNSEYIKKINFSQWLNYTIEICLIVYYLNNVLGIYHNDLCYKNDIRNIMIKKTNTKNKISVGSFNFETEWGISSYNRFWSSINRTKN
jgi:hypothetical protein